MFCTLASRILLTVTCVVGFCLHTVAAQSDVLSAKEHLERARLYIADEDPRAEVAYRQAIADRGGIYPEAWQELSSYLAQKLRFDEAASAWLKYLKQARRNNQSTELDRLRRLEKAAELKTRNDKGDVLSAEEMVDLVRLVDGFGVKGDAIPYAERAVKLYPGSTKALVVLAALIKWEQKDRALDLLNRAVTLEPTEPYLYVERGRCYFWAHGNPFEAEADFRRAIELSKGSNTSAWAALGDSLARQGRTEDAIAAYRKYLSIRPKSAAQYDGEIRKSIKMLQGNASEP